MDRHLYACVYTIENYASGLTRRVSHLFHTRSDDENTGKDLQTSLAPKEVPCDIGTERPKESTSLVDRNDVGRDKVGFNCCVLPPVEFRLKMS
jgi:hypothetical protein